MNMGGKDQWDAFPDAPPTKYAETAKDIAKSAGIGVAKRVIGRDGPMALGDFDKVIRVNLIGSFNMLRLATAPMSKLEPLATGERGVVISTASVAAYDGQIGQAAYSASKGGIVALTHALAVSLGPDIRVNCVSPGWIETKDQGALRRKDHAQHPAGRVGKPQDIAEIVFWLLDRERSGFVTGANFVVDGGMTRKMIYT
jgi:NAD(P)-dependent dehydrogenase (short-subunit alcohol dehydrogenase family)